MLPDIVRIGWRTREFPANQLKRKGARSLAAGAGKSESLLLLRRSGIKYSVIYREAKRRGSELVFHEADREKDLDYPCGKIMMAVLEPGAAAFSLCVFTSPLDQSAVSRPANLLVPRAELFFLFIYCADQGAA